MRWYLSDNLRINEKMHKTHKIHFGTFKIQQDIVDLYINIEVDGELIMATIPIPDGYPSTEIGTTTNLLFSSILFYDDISQISTDTAIDRPSLYLSTFYVIPKKLHLIPNADEELMLTEMGKKALCITVNWLRDWFQMDNDDYIILMADGSGSRSVTQVEIQQVIIVYPREYLARYIGQFQMDVCLDELSHEELAVRYLETINNRQLVSYYQRRYGFEITEDYGDTTRMATSIKIFLNHCQ